MPDVMLTVRLLKHRGVILMISTAILLITFTLWFFLVFRASVNTCLWQSEYDAKKPIPKTIHRIWDTGPMPERFQTNWENCKRINPDYNVTLWDNKAIEDLISQHYPWFLRFYNAYPYHMEQLDAGRYFIIYHYGGVYIDMDVDCIVPFDEIFKKADAEFNVMIGGGLPVGLATSFFVSQARHPFMHFMIRGLQKSLGWYISPYWSVMASTGPIYIYVNYLKFPCKEDIYVLAPHLHKNVYMIHEHAGTWHRWDGPIYVWIDRHLKYVMIMLLLSVGLIGYLFYKRRVGIKNSLMTPKSNGILQEKILNGYH